MDVFGFFDVYRASCSLRIMGQLIKVLSLSLSLSGWPINSKRAVWCSIDISKRFTAVHLEFISCKIDMFRSVMTGESLSSDALLFSANKLTCSEDFFLVFGPLNKNKLASEVHIITTENPNPNPLFWRKANWTFLGKLNSFSWAKVIFVPWQRNLTEIESDIFLLDGIRVRVKVGVLTDDDWKSQTVKVKNQTLWAFLQIFADTTTYKPNSFFLFFYH